MKAKFAAVLLACLAGPAFAQKYKTDIPAAITMPDRSRRAWARSSSSTAFPTTRPCRRSTTTSTSSAACRRS